MASPGGSSCICSCLPPASACGAFCSAGAISGISAGLWLVCEILVDIGAVHEMSIGLFSAAAALGAMGLMFALGLLLCALVCRLLRRKQLA